MAASTNERELMLDLKDHFAPNSDYENLEMSFSNLLTDGKNHMSWPDDLDNHQM